MACITDVNGGGLNWTGLEWHVWRLERSADTCSSIHFSSAMLDDAMTLFFWTEFAGTEVTK